MMNKRIVFIGDSITEWGKEQGLDNIGTGYVKYIYDYLLVSDPQDFPEIINCGIGGDRITDLANRWQQDVVDLQPDILSISVGINDVWRQLDEPEIEQVMPEKFELIYRELLLKTLKETNATIIIMEPTVIGEEIKSEGNKKLQAYVQIIAKLATEFNLIVVPTHQAFLTYLQANNEHELTIDGVHMNDVGNLLMAKTWLETYNKLNA
ncbi:MULTISPECIES: SGNH/GDSL hydrolase family protein [Paraliobacillus]|uniref:SGNH/GDSL hydrolase family protein n=1 Tax=Paraliobacillus TaxID=200903 RepID=UPI000DD35CCA|nr:MULTISPECIES: SGNH/GDSL hydrolase family protein [Paraliobacillus]